MSGELNEEQKKFLLALARKAIERSFTGSVRFQSGTQDPVLKEKRGAFVTLKIDGELRGCIGYPLPYKPLDETIIEMAIAAASQDYRFAPLEPEEFEKTKIEISVLTQPVPVKNPRDVEVGRHGIIVAKGGRQGLLLPQVPVEYGWSCETFLCQGCLKAGLPKDEWQKGAKIEVFEAQVFSEEA
jgi:AmmeMemoRadiSam system protein A